MRRLLVVAVAACGSSGPAPDRSVEQAGPYAVGTSRFEGAASYVMQAWYPTEAAVVAIEQLEISPQRELYAGLLASRRHSRTIPARAHIWTPHHRAA